MSLSVVHCLLFLAVSLFSVLSSQTVFSEENSDSRFKTSADIPYDTNIRFGKHFKSLDIYAPLSGKNHPVVIWVHGGAWKIGDKRGVDSKPAAFTQQGYLLVSLNYRLHPQASYDQQAEDIAQAIRWVREHAAEYGGNPDELFLLGHSAGAHLVALVSTNPVYLRQQSLSLKSIKGTILLDGAGYDLAEHMATAGPTARKMYSAVFSEDPKTWKAASPITYVRKNQSIPPFLILHVARRADSGKQSEAFAKKLKQNQIKAEVIAVPGKTHLTINREIGLPEDLPTQKIFEFLKSVPSPADR